MGATELVKKIRRLQPDIVLNDRLSNEALKKATGAAYTGDYEHTSRTSRGAVDERARTADTLGRVVHGHQRLVF